MRRAALLLALGLALPAGAARAQEPAPAEPVRERVELSVTSAGPGTRAVVDKGRADGLAEGDVVLLEVGGEELSARVVSLDERTAVLRLDRRGALPQPGTSGVALVAPRASTTAPATSPERAAAPPPELELELRVMALDAEGRPVVDRGRDDGLRLGDAARLLPLDSAPLEARVVALEARSATLALDDAGATVAPGTRGRATLPGTRLEGAGAPTPAPEAQPPAPLPPVVKPPPRAPDAPRPLELRVGSVGPGASVMIDRGAEDGLALADHVVFQSEDGRPLDGRVARLGNNTAVVELLDPTRLPARGARGEVLLPAERFLVETTELEEAAPEHPPWTDDDAGYEAGMPLLSQVRAVRPEERPKRVTGFGYFSAQTRFTGQDYGDSFYRLGGGVSLENPFGKGGAIQADAELNYRTLTLPDDQGYGQDTFRLRLDRLSYRWGGTRFRDGGFEVGRFLQRVMPELGILDGGEWVQRRAGGDRFGASAGWMPEASPDMTTGRDFQVAAFYEWVADEREELTVAAAVQKTWHDGAPDRDLFVGRVRYLPREPGWDFQGTVWVDYYDDGDALKESGFELTQAWLSSRRTWESGNGLELLARHIATPDLLRDQQAPLTAEQIAEGRYDRLAVGGWRWLGKGTRLFGELGGWDDERDAGGDALLGIELSDVFLSATRAELSAFATQGQYSQVLGGRARYSRLTAGGSWELLYELSAQRQDGFTAAFDDILQHRLRGSRDFRLGSPWRLSLFAEGLLWDDEPSVNLGFFLQRSF